MRKTCLDVISEPRSHVKIIAFAFFVVGPVWYMVLDREPPYERVAGVITPANPGPGDAFEVDWTIKPLRSHLLGGACHPAGSGNVIKVVVDADGHNFGFENVSSMFGHEGMEPDRITRRMKLSRGVSPGVAKYKSTACYTCNPLQDFGITRPICVNTPDLIFNVGPLNRAPALPH